MSSSFISNLFRFIFLLAIQVVLFNQFDFLRFINPYPYLLFILLYPVNGNRYGLLFASFFLGLLMDMFSDSGGVHAAACVTLAYLRPSFFKFSFGLSYEYQTVKINERLTPQRFSFLFISVITHHLILFALEIFRFTFLWEILVRTFLSSIFTLVLCICLIYLFKPVRK